MNDNTRTTRIALASIAVLIILLTLMSTVFRISGAVIASGSVAVEGDVKRVVHPTGGVLSEVLVANGDRVEAGDILLRLDASVSSIGSSASQDSLQAMLVRKARLEAERDGSKNFVPPRDVTDAETIAEQRKLFELRRQSLSDSHYQMRERMAQIEQGSLALQAQITSVDRQRELFEKERQGIQSLYDRGLVTLPRYTQTERTAVDLEAQAEGLRAQLAQSRAQMAETRQRDSQIDQDFRSEAGAELAVLDAQIAEMRTQFATRDDQNRRNEIVAPHEGVVDKLAYTTIGSYLPPGQVVLEVVPDRGRDMVEVKIAPQDIDQISIGQGATLHFTAFSQQTTPTVPGKVEWVSAERDVDQATGMQFYRARIAVETEDMARLEGLDLRAGMPVDAYIGTGERTIMSYLLKPLLDQMNRAFL